MQKKVKDNEHKGQRLKELQPNEPATWCQQLTSATDRCYISLQYHSMQKTFGKNKVEQNFSTLLFHCSK